MEDQSFVDIQRGWGEVFSNTSHIIAPLGCWFSGMPHPFFYQYIYLIK